MSAPTDHTSSTQDAEQNHLGLERLIFFSDAVFAIAITLLALEIRLPAPAEGGLTNEALLSLLVSLWPKYLAYILSFWIIGAFWIGHHRRYRYIQRYDGTLLLLNLLLLMAVAFVPFPTAVISEYGNRTGTIFYALTMVVIGLISALIWGYASYKHRLIDAEMPQRQIRRDMLRLLVVPAIFALSIGIAFSDADLAKYSWILVLPGLMLIR
ncbi:MAG: DUF1211 domain-containing protein [Anaerolineae bacterium]|nr:DUF1211 domain-containing protein [Anaerolineae bacterium]